MCAEVLSESKTLIYDRRQVTAFLRANGATLDNFDRVTGWYTFAEESKVYSAREYLGYNNLLTHDLQLVVYFDQPLAPNGDLIS